jgi:amino acid transporter
VIASFIIGGLILLFAILAAPDLSDPAIAENGLQYIILSVLGGPTGTVLLFAVIIAITVCALAVHTAAIRLMFAMARDNALPGAARLAHLDPKRKTPLVPAVLIGVAAVLILVVNIGSREIFTAVTSVAIIMIYIAYLLVTAPMLVKRFRGEWPGPSAGKDGYFSLGRWGLPVNIIAVLWGGLMALNLAWPRPEVYGEGVLAWTAFIFIGAVVVIGLGWFLLRGRHQVGTLPEHLAKQLDVDPAPRPADQFPEGSQA